MAGLTKTIAASAFLLALGAGGAVFLLRQDVRVEAQQRVPPPDRAAVQYSFAPIVRQSSPKVVNVYVSSRVRSFRSPFANDPFFRHFFGDRFGSGAPTERMQSSLGSGVIVSPDGVVVTNTHVIKKRGRTEIRIALSDKREFPARVITEDQKTDIAILKIENGSEKFPYMEFEDSDNLEVGDLVLAIGNPFGVGQTVTSGIVSALARSQIKSDAVFIQTDAAINPGNSGGALVDVSGKLVGINTAIFSRSGGSHGVGFAIPANLVRLYVDGALEGRQVERVWLGARLDNVTRDLADALGLPRVAGAVVTRVYNGSPADRAGLEPGDVITGVGQFDAEDARSVQYRLTTMGVGKSAKLKLIRNGQPYTVKVALRAAPKPGRNDIRNLTGAHPFDGARVANIKPVVAEELGLDETDGVVVMSVKRGGYAARLGLRKGDIVVRVSGRDISRIGDLERAIAKRKRVWTLAIRRGGRLREMRVPG